MNALLPLVQADPAARPAIDPTDVAVLSAGFTLVAVALIAMLRRRTLMASAAADGLRVGGRVLGWADVIGLQHGFVAKQPWYRIVTANGSIDLHENDFAQPHETLRDEIVQRAGLSELSGARAPTIADLRTASYREWAVPAPVAPSEPAPVTPKPSARSKRKPETGVLGKVGGALAAALAALVKFGKLALLSGLKIFKFGKILPTALTMLLSIWVYAQAFGWRFAVGFVVLIFVHEMGHAAVMRAKGLRTSAIVFLPFFGAFIGLKDQLRDARTEAEIGYGGPAAGTLAATLCFAIYLSTGDALWLGLAYSGFFLNLFNLLPVSPLDGGRVVTAISTWLWVVGLALAGVLALSVGSPILIIVVLLGAFRAWGEWRGRGSAARAGYYDLTPRYRAAIACAYFGLCGYLGWMAHRALELGGALDVGS